MASDLVAHRERRVAAEPHVGGRFHRHGDAHATQAGVSPHHVDTSRPERGALHEPSLDADEIRLVRRQQDAPVDQHASARRGRIPTRMRPGAATSAGPNS